MTKPQSPQARELNSYYKSVRIQRSVIHVLMAIIIILVGGIVGIAFYSQNTYLVSIPGQTFSAQRSYYNPYRKFNAEQTVIDFCALMFQFNANTYEEDLKKATFLASNQVYQTWYDYYYVTPQEDTGDPLYYSFVRNDITMELHIEQFRSFETKTGFTIEFYGEHLYRKTYDYLTQTDIPVHFVLEVTPNQSTTSRNRLGYSVSSLEFDNMVWDRDTEEMWTATIENDPS